MKKGFIILLGLLCLLITGCGNSDVRPQLSGRYLAVQDDQIGYLTLPERTFAPIIKNLKVIGITGILNEDVVLVLADSGQGSGLYQINLRSKEVVPMVALAVEAALSPDNKKVLFMTTDRDAEMYSTCLAYYDLQSKETMFVSKGVVDRVWWSADSKKLLYSRAEEPLGSPHVYVYDTIRNKSLPLDGVGGLATGWLNGCPLIRETGLENPRLGGVNAYSIDTKDKFRNPVHYDVPFVSWLDMREDQALLCQVSGEEIRLEEWLIPSMKGKLLTKTAFYIEIDDHRSSVYIRARFINKDQVFYRVFTSENEELIQAGLICVDSGLTVLLDKTTADIISLGG